MALDIKVIEYYKITVDGNIGEGAKLLSAFADAGVNLLAFKALTLEPMRIQFALFPDNALKMNDGAKNSGLNLDGPYSALLVKGDTDESGELAGIYEKLSQAHINVQESSGIADIKEGYGVILYLKQEDIKKAVVALEK